MHGMKIKIKNVEPYHSLGGSESFHVLMEPFLVTSFKDMDILAYIF
jgi:hypothetical protein